MNELIMEKTKSGKYLRVVCDIINYLYQSSRITPPEWLEDNQLFELRGVNFLKKSDRDKTKKLQQKGGDEP